MFNLIKLSELVLGSEVERDEALAYHIPPVVHSDTFVKHIRSLVGEGFLMGAELPDKFTLPKMFRKRSGAVESKSVYDMALVDDERLVSVVNGYVRELGTKATRGAGGSRRKPTVDVLLSDEALFMARVAETQKKIAANGVKGAKMAFKRFKSEPEAVEPEIVAPAKKAAGKRK